LLTVDEKPSDLRARDAAAYLSRHGITPTVIERPTMAVKASKRSFAPC
jgi:hypothetical protein